MKILLVGAGSVAQVLAFHLQQGGAQVTFLARKARAEKINQGLWMIPLNRRRARERPLRFENFSTLTSLDGLPADWDQVFFCLPSDALSLRYLNSIREKVAAATIVKLQPGLEDLALFTSVFGENQLVNGMIAFIAYPAPLPGEKVAQSGTAYWLPPLLGSGYSGPGARVNAVVAALKAGGYPARQRRNAGSLLGLALALELPLMLGLEIEHWSFERFRNSQILRLVVQAMREAAQIIADYQGKRASFLLKVVQPWNLKLATRLLPPLLPMDIETYLKIHFTKMEAQSDQHVADLIQLAKEQGRSSVALEKLQSRLEEARA